jgi:putative intracellular protease/amidase
MEKAYVLLFHGYADWELGYVLAEIRRLGNIEVVAVGFSDAPVLSMGGLKVMPEIILSQVEPEDVRIFLLPGGDMWEKEYPEKEIENLLHLLDKNGTPMAAICGATTVLAKAGLLNDRRHTSNSLQYLKDNAPGYAGERNYVDKLAVTDKNITTASGLGSVEFTMNILAHLNVSTPRIRGIWYEAFKYGRYPEHFDHGT